MTLGVNVTVPLLCVNVPLFKKLPAKLIVPEVEMSVPALIIKPLRVTALPPKLSEPDPAFVKLLVLSLIIPPTVSVPALTVICRSALNVTVPVPKLRFRLPTKMKSAFIANG